MADNRTLGVDRSDAVTSGRGDLRQRGGGAARAGHNHLTGDSSFSGGTTISAGTLQLGNGGTTGSIVGDVADNGTLAFNRSDAVTFPGVISGSGAVAQIGSGTTILTADNPYTGRTRVSAGALVVGDSAHPSAALSGGGPITVAHGATLGGYGSVIGSVFNNGVIAAGNATPGFDTSPTGTFTIIGNLLNQGLAKVGSDPTIGNVLEVRGNYVGAGGTMAINTFLGGDGSPSDGLVINGGTATGNTRVQVTNVGGPGAETTGDGILVVDAINGATTAPGAFPSGELAAGPFDYRLFRGGVGGDNPSDWFLRSDFVVPPIPPGGRRWRRRRWWRRRWWRRRWWRWRGGGGGGAVAVEVEVEVEWRRAGGSVMPLPPFPPDPPPNPLPPGVYPIIGPRLATYGVVQPIARQLGLTQLGTLHERIGDTLTAAYPEGEGGVRSAWGRFFGQQIDNRYQAFADPRASGSLLGVQTGLDLWRGSLYPRPSRCRRPLLRLRQQRCRCDRAGHQPGSNRLCSPAHRHPEPQLLFRRRLLDTLRPRRLVSRRGAAGHRL